MSESVLLAALELPESIILGAVILGACYIVGTLIETRSIVRARAYQIEDQLDPRCPIEPGANLKLITAETVLEAAQHREDRDGLGFAISSVPFPHAAATPWRVLSRSSWFSLSCKL